MREAPGISANGAANVWRSTRSAIAAAAADGDFSAVNEKSGIKTVLFDERCTTMAAENYLNLSDTRGKKRKQVIDAVAAVIILEDFIRLRKIK